MENVMEIEKKAAELHARGFNCAQCVLCACGEYTKLDEKTALAISGGFGGGVRSGEICGAISGAVMALGMAAQYTDPADTQAKRKIAALTKECVQAFKEKYGCVRCIELKQAGVSCAELIEYGAQLAENRIDSNFES